jgi:DNA polymerase
MSAPYKQIVTIDFETYWDTASGYTLSKMTTEEYIRHERFKAFGACLHEFGTDKITQWYRADELPKILATYDWSTTAVLAHNAQFDVSILSWVYGVKPCFILDSLSMARALRGVEVGNSLARLAQAFGLPDKGNAVYNTNGVEELSWDMEKELADYCVHDVYLCEQIFSRLAVGYPTKELRLIDMTLKMYTHPVLELDANMLTDALHDEKEKREALLARLDLTDSVLASNVHFAEALRNVGIEPPTKKKKPTAKTPNPVGVNFAFAKTDAMFQAMLNGDNEDVAALCEARLKVKSTTERTRAQRFLDIAGRGTLPVPLSYYGAATGRWTASKGSAINMQNLKRGSFLRKAIMAPKGYQLVVGDLSQIEPRVLAWLADYDELLRIFVAGGDPYAQFGAQMFNIPGMSKESHPDLRQSAKSALLGAGYGLGWASFASQLLVGFLGAPPVRYERKFAKALGVTAEDVEKFLDNEDYIKKMNEIPHICTKAELLIHCLAAKKIIDKYRKTAQPVVDFWNLCGQLIETSLYGGKEYTYKCLTFKKGEIVLPSGMSLLYPDLKRSKDEKGRVQWTYGPDSTKLYAGKITNNVTQGVARCVMTDGMLRTAKKYFVAGTVHDEQIVVVPDAEVEDAKTWVLAQMTMEPRYMPGIPLDADGGAHRRYGLAKN